jgi:hypothetical protein
VLKERYPSEWDKTNVSADKMSEFYRTFLNQQWKKHLDFNVEWQKRNAHVLFLSAAVALESLFKKN